MTKNTSAPKYLKVSLHSLVQKTSIHVKWTNSDGLRKWHLNCSLHLYTSNWTHRLVGQWGLFYVSRPYTRHVLHSGRIQMWPPWCFSHRGVGCQWVARECLGCCCSSGLAVVRYRASDGSYRIFCPLYFICGSCLQLTGCLKTTEGEIIIAKEQILDAWSKYASNRP